MYSYIHMYYENMCVRACLSMHAHVCKYMRMFLYLYLYVLCAWWCAPQKEKPYLVSDQASCVPG